MCLLQRFGKWDASEKLQMKLRRTFLLYGVSRSLRETLEYQSAYCQDGVLWQSIICIPLYQHGSLSPFTGFWCISAGKTSRNSSDAKLHFSNLSEWTQQIPHQRQHSAPLKGPNLGVEIQRKCLLHAVNKKMSEKSHYHGKCGINILAWKTQNFKFTNINP